MGQVSLGFPVGETKPEVGVLLYMLSAEQGDASRQFNLAVVKERDIGVPKNENLAAAWYEKSVIQGFDVAQNNLGVSISISISMGAGFPRILPKLFHSIVSVQSRATEWHKSILATCI